jgi:hypothetical protein
MRSNQREKKKRSGEILRWNKKKFVESEQRRIVAQEKRRLRWVELVIKRKADAKTRNIISDVKKGGSCKEK